MFSNSMDGTTLPSLPSLDEAPVSMQDSELPELHPGFFIPRLTDKPQNPIMDTISLVQRARDSAYTPHSLPVEVEALAEDMWAVAKARQRIESNLWQQVAQEKTSDRHRLMSWETLRSSFNAHTIPPAFLSQQNTRVFASVRHYVRPRVHDPARPLVYVSGEELLQSLHLTLTGISSSVYVWDSASEQFTLRAVPQGTSGTLVLVGTDEVISASIVERFLTVGTLMRRLEILVQEYNTRHSHADQIIHSFIHALSSVLDHLRTQLADSVDFDLPTTDASGLTAVWTRYGLIEDVLNALGRLCGRQQDTVPSKYQPLPTTAVDLLSGIYLQLDEALENSTLHTVTAILAYILTVTSKDYFRHIGDSVGYNTSTTQSADVASSGDDGLGLGAGDDDAEEQDDTFYEDQAAEEPYPIFIQAALSDAFPRAKRSLKLLREARPDHALLRGRDDGSKSPDINWFWTDAEIAAAWTGRNESTQPARALVDAASRSAVEFSPEREYKAELREFALFDLAPGQQLGLFATTAAQLSATDDLQSFIDAFPSSLSSLTPTLSHLTSLVLSPLTQHMEALSGALVTLFLSPTDLNLPLHLSVLRSYLLLTSHTFKSRITAALFSDTDDPPDLATKASTARRRESDPSADRWAVGLSPVLTVADVWPPSVPELSFQLRTVINDSLQSSLGPSSEHSLLAGMQDAVIRDAEHRLGFAIRDLPTGTGKEKWLDPLSIEALDFLYLDYKPPRPLHVVITPDVLSKYHRIFAFNLRLMRASNAIAATYRITRKHSAPLFPTLTQSNKLLLHARFVAHAFITALSSYIYDRAIGLRFADFLAQLTGPSASSARATQPPAFADVFALADRHSAVLDDILSACLLRSGQKAVGDVLRACLELVLELAVLAGDRYRGRLEEYQAAPLLEDLWERFRKRMATLIKVLRALVERGSGTSRAAVLDVEAQLANLSRLDGVTGSLHDLVTRLDVADWWARR